MFLPSLISIFIFSLLGVNEEVKEEESEESVKEETNEEIGK
ncbi:unnamed protein product [marine sediment metagenome]|uniref:Uncharacterized protein n=1 Tax=marine sediment metagenome TaxID=412755 RepID=X1TK07_9ZZZZ